MPREAVIMPAQEGKGRAFRSLCLATVEADNLWEAGQTSTDDMRPVWAMFAGTVNELRPFTANVQLGKKVIFARGDRYIRRGEARMELLRSAGYQFTWQHETEGSVVTAFLPDLFRLDPGMVDPHVISFVVLPPAEWAREQKGLDLFGAASHAAKLNFKASEETLVSLVPTSYLFTAFLDRRTRCPIPADGRFYLQLMCACLTQGLASFSTDGTSSTYRDRDKFGHNSYLRFKEEGTADVGLLPGVAFKATHEEFEAVLAEQVGLFYQLTGGR
jgi:hypothetical protein